MRCRRRADGRRPRRGACRTSARARGESRDARATRDRGLRSGRCGRRTWRQHREKPPGIPGCRLEKSRLGLSLPMRPTLAMMSLALLLVIASPARAADVAVCDAPGTQTNPVAAPDGRGGAIVAWADARGGGYDVYAQHLLASGRVDPSWPAAGLPLCEAPDDQAAPTIVSDDRGGAIIAWFDQRGGKDH